jgi:hypothetical protein
MDKMEMLKLKAEIANCERIADTTVDPSIAKALETRAAALRKQVSKAESQDCKDRLG